MDMDETPPEYTLWRALGERRYRERAVHHEATIRAELVAKVRDAIFNDPKMAWAASDIDRMAEIAVDTLADYYRAQLTS